MAHQKNNRNTTLTLRVTLSGFYPAIWRRISIPGSFSFYQLHLAIQAAFGWENNHLFLFEENNVHIEYAIGIPDEDDQATDARRIKLKKIFRKPGDMFMYVYDFGDHWKHIIELEMFNSHEIHTAICENGENECPPENVGGTGGYQQMLDTFQSGTPAEKKEYGDWLGLSSGEAWNVLHYNQREVNKRMALLIPERLTFG